MEGTPSELEDIVNAVAEDPSVAVPYQNKEKQQAADTAQRVEVVADFMSDLSKKGEANRVEVPKLLTAAAAVVMSMEKWPARNTGAPSVQSRAAWAQAILEAATEAVRNVRGGIDLANWEIGAIGMVATLTGTYGNASTVGSWSINDASKQMEAGTGLKASTIRERIDTFKFYLPEMDRIVALLVGDTTGLVSWSHFNRARRLCDNPKDATDLVDAALSNQWSVRTMEEKALAPVATLTPEQVYLEACRRGLNATFSIPLRPPPAPNDSVKANKAVDDAYVALRASAFAFDAALVEWAKTHGGTNP